MAQPFSPTKRALTDEQRRKLKAATRLSLRSRLRSWSFWLQLLALCGVVLAKPWIVVGFLWLDDLIPYHLHEIAVALVAGWLAIRLAVADFREIRPKREALLAGESESLDTGRRILVSLICFQWALAAAISFFVSRALWPVWGGHFREGAAALAKELMR